MLGEEGLCFWLVFGGSISWLQYGDSYPESPHILEGPVSEGSQVPGSPCIPGLPPWGPWGWACAVSGPCIAKGGGGPYRGEAQSPKMGLSGRW